MMGQWKIKSDTNKEGNDIFRIELIGDLPLETAPDFLRDFNYAQNHIKDYNNTIIVFDLSRYKLYPCYVEQALRPFFEIYKARCYKRVIMNLFKPQKVLGYKMEQLAKKLFLRDMLEIVYI